MNIGIIKEVKDGERRVACTPQGVASLISSNHKVFIQAGAGAGSGYTDEAYELEGAHVVANAKELYGKSTLIYKVKEIDESEYKYLRQNHIILTFLHTNGNSDETTALLESKCTSIALEDICDKNGEYPVLKPMSVLAGKIAFIEALNLSKTTNSGSGVLLNHIKKMKIPEIVIFGAGNAGRAAAGLATAFGNHVTMVGRGKKNLSRAKSKLPPDTDFLVSNQEGIATSCSKADVIINCVLWPKNKSGHLLSIKDLSHLKKNCLIMDVSCDVSGAIESCKPTSISNPTYTVCGITHCCIDNLPSLYATTATDVLCELTLPYVLEIANKGIMNALLADKFLRNGLTTFFGRLTLEETAIKQSRLYTPTTEKMFK